MAAPNRVLSIWQRMSGLPMGKQLFSRLVCLRAPYFASIRPVFDELRPGYAVAHARKRRAVENHIGTFHAIALCNLAEFVAGTLSEASVPATHRWIPKGMTVEYLKKAETDISAVAELSLPDPCPDGIAMPVCVDLRDRRETVVARATITMWVTAKKKA